MSTGQDSSAKAPGAIGTEAVRAAFAAGTDVDACAALTQRVNRLAGRALQAFGDAGIACRRGCDFCCHLRVMVRPHEAIALYRALATHLPQQQAREVRQRVLDNASRIGRLGPGGHAAARVACAFLVDGACSVYAVRPLACAGFHSLDRARCEQDHVRAGSASGGGTGAGIPMLQGLTAAVGVLEAGMDAALAARGLDCGLVELHEAVAALIGNPGFIARWRGGRSWRVPRGS